MARWVLIVHELDHEIKHRSGKQNLNVDASFNVSYNPVPTSTTTYTETDEDTFGSENESCCIFSENASTKVGEARLPNAFYCLILVLFC